MRLLSTVAVLFPTVMFSISEAQTPGIADLTFGRLFSYHIGDTAEAVHDHAAHRGDRLRCVEVSLPELPNRSVCSVEYAGNGRAPESIADVLLLLEAPPLPPYSLYFKGDRLDFFTVSFWPAPRHSRARLIAHLDSIGTRAFEGRSATVAESETMAWIGRDKRDFARVDCRPAADAEICTIAILRLQTVEGTDRYLQRLRALAPLPLDGG